jgi:hypothetical protein
MICDALNQTIGACEERVVKEWRRLWNPLNWVIEAIAFVIRIPFLIFEAAGFDSSKVEDHFLSKVFKLVEIVAILAGMIFLGLKKAEVLASQEGFDQVSAELSILRF